MASVNRNTGVIGSDVSGGGERCVGGGGGGNGFMAGIHMDVTHG